MKLKLFFLYFILIMMCQFTWSQEIEWIQIKGVATDLSAGGIEKLSVWVISEDGIYKWDGNSWIDKIKFGQESQVKKIAVDQIGNPYIINQKNEIFGLTKSKKWKLYPGISAHEIAVSVSGDIYVIGINDQGKEGLFKWNEEKWDFWSSYAVKVSVDSQGVPWVVSQKGKIYKWNQTSWQEWPGLALSIHISNNGKLWIILPKKVEGGYQIARWLNNGWQVINKGAVAMSIDPWGRPWIVNENSEIYWGNIE